MNATNKPIPNTTIDNPLSGAVKRIELYASYIYKLCIFVPAFMYLFKVNEYAADIPYVDEYDSILDFLSKFKQASFSDKFFLLFSQYIDHRILLSRIITVIYYYLFGKINFIPLVFIGNLQLVVIFLILIHFIRKAIPKYWNFVSLVAGLCIFDLSSYENAIMALSGLYSVIMLFLVSLFFYTKNSMKNIIWAAIFEFICIFSSANGMFFALSIFLFLLIKKERQKVIISGSVLVICSALFFIQFTRANPTGMAFSLIRDIRFFFLLLGGHFSYTYGLPIGIATFVLMLLLLPITIRGRKIFVKDNALPFLCILCALMFSVLIICVFRSTLRGELGAYTSHYLILSHLIIAIIFLFAYIRFQGKKIMVPLAIFAIIILLWGYTSNYEYGDSCMAIIKKRKENIPYCYGQLSNDYMMKGKAIEQQACSLGIYCIDDKR